MDFLYDTDDQYLIDMCKWHIDKKSGYVQGGNAKYYFHRMVMIGILGKDKLKGMEVHHINENKLDNRRNNLELLTITEHRRLHTVGKKRPDISAMMQGNKLWKLRK